MEVKPSPKNNRGPKQYVEVRWEDTRFGHRFIKKWLFWIGAFVLVLAIVSRMPNLFSTVFRMESRISETAGGFVNILFLLILIVICIKILHLGFNGRMLQAACLFIAVFPISSRVMTARAMTLFVDQYTNQQVQISITTLTVLLLFFFHESRKRKNHSPSVKRNPVYHLILFYWAIVFLVQMIHHSPVAAFNLAFVYILQPFMFLVLLVDSIEKKYDLYLFECAFVVSVILTIMVRFSQDISLSSISARAAKTSGAYGQFIPYAEILAFMLPVMIALWVVYRDDLPRRRILIFSIILVVVELIGTGTRGALFSLAALSLFFLDRRTRKPFLFICFLSGLLFLLAWPFFGAMYLNRAIYLDSRIYEIDSVAVRLMIDSDAMIKAIQNPVFGYGIGYNFTYNVSEVHGRVHNTFVSLAIMAGIPALTVFILIVWRALLNTFYRIRHASTPNERILAIGVTAGIFSFLISGMTSGGELFWGNNHEWKMMLFGLIALSVIVREKELK